MCLTVYIASDIALPSTDTPDFVVRQIQERERLVARHFSKPNIYFIGAYTGCACGFQPDPEDAEPRSKSLSGLLQFLDAHAPNEQLELFVSWAGREKHAAKSNLTFARSELPARTDWCEEQTLVALAG